MRKRFDRSRCGTRKLKMLLALGIGYRMVIKGNHSNLIFGSKDGNILLFDQYFVTKFQGFSIQFTELIVLNNLRARERPTYLGVNSFCFQNFWVWTKNIPLSLQTEFLL